jgi:hypothetical protein
MHPIAIMMQGGPAVSSLTPGGVIKLAKLRGLAVIGCGCSCKIGFAWTGRHQSREPCRKAHACVTSDQTLPSNEYTGMCKAEHQALPVPLPIRRYLSGGQAGLLPTTSNRLVACGGASARAAAVSTKVVTTGAEPAVRSDRSPRQTGRIWTTQHIPSLRVGTESDCGRKVRPTKYGG